MKKLYALLSALMFTGAILAADVTFTVNMTNETISANGVHLAGGFDANGSSGIAWNPGAYTMTDMGNGYYVYTVTGLNAGKYEFKFINDNDWAGVENVPMGSQVGGGNSNRWVYVDSLNMNVDTVAFGGMADLGKHGVLLNVNMATTSVSSAGVHVAGTFQGWSPGTTEMHNPDGGSVYKHLFQVNPGESIEFKYVNGDIWGDDESVPAACAQNNNRFFNNITGDSIYAEVCYGACDVCATADVTFQVDMSNETVSANGVHVAGSFQGWDPAGTALTDMGGGIWEVTLALQKQTHAFKFVNGDAWGTEETVPSACIVGGNREIVVNGDTTYKVCFASCTWPCVQFPDSATITWNLEVPDTLPVSTDPDSGGVWIMGSFTSPSWQDGAIKLDDLGNNKYSTSLKLGGNPELQYKFVLNKPNTTGAVEESGDFLTMGCGVSNPVSTPNRILNRTENDSAVAYCWNQCSETCTVGILEVGNSLEGVAIYPNPFTDRTRIEFAETGNYNVSLIDITGKVIRVENVIGNSLELNAANLNRGIYILRVEDQNGLTGQYKLIVN